MKNLSKWANKNPMPARIIIALSHILLIINALFFGILLFLFDWGETRWLTIIAANLFFLYYLLYPKKKKGNSYFKWFYLRRKAHDFSLVVLYAMVISFGVNNYLVQNNRDYGLNQQATARLVVYEVKPKKEKNINLKKSKLNAKAKFKKLRKQIKKKIRSTRKAIKKEEKKGWILALKILLSILVSVLAFLLGYLIAALACGIACSGQEGLAIVVLALGWGGVIWLTFVTIKHIFDRVGNKEMTT